MRVRPSTSSAQGKSTLDQTSPGYSWAPTLTLLHGQGLGEGKDIALGLQH